MGKSVTDVLDLLDVVSGLDTIEKVDQGEGDFAILVLLDNAGEGKNLVGYFRGDSYEDAVAETVDWLADRGDDRFPPETIGSLLDRHPLLNLDSPDFTVSFLSFRKDENGEQVPITKL